MFIAVRHGLCTFVMIDKGQGAEFITEDWALVLYLSG